MVAPSVVRQSETFTRSYTPAPIAGNFAGKHVVTVEQFAHADMQTLFAAAVDLRARVRRGDRSVLDLCAGKVMATLFYEASTRTDMSFQAAMQRLGGDVISTAGGVQFSSVYKGENLADTVRAVGCYADAIVLRHPEVGSSYEAAYYLDRLGERLGKRTVVVSGGDGIGEHPTQALLDLFTIIDCERKLDHLNITMVGDLRYGRTVHSLSKLIALYEATGTMLNFVSPDALKMPSSVLDFLKARGIRYYETSDLHEVIGSTDVIYWTRIQQERFSDPADYEAIAGDFIMTPELFAEAKSDTILMHPLPRKHEMGTTDDHDILDADPRSVYFKQMENGMFVRMALLAQVLGAS
ncbi:MAG TPA: aspartate carbamoyltransferase [Phototrophicaceae bacterium]|nr:aspartate carbamoyltransferase [Phototrophicaceae bacterium]